MTTEKRETNGNGTLAVSDPINQIDLDREGFEREERRLKLRNLKLDVWVKPLSYISAIIACSLAYLAFNNSKEQEEKWKNAKHIVEKTISVSQSPINGETSVMVVDIDLINRGGSTIRPYAHALVSEKLYQNEGLYFTVREISTEPNRLVGSDDGKIVFGPTNILEQYEKSKKWYDTYRIKPQTTYHESAAVVLARKRLYQITSRFYMLSGPDDGWTLTESRYVYIK